jgi:hypothetical protein
MQGEIHRPPRACTEMSGRLSHPSRKSAKQRTTTESTIVECKSKRRPRNGRKSTTNIIEGHLQRDTTTNRRVCKGAHLKHGFHNPSTGAKTAVTISKAVTNSNRGWISRQDFQEATQPSLKHSASHSGKETANTDKPVGLMNRQTLLSRLWDRSKPHRRVTRARVFRPKKTISMSSDSRKKLTLHHCRLFATLTRLSESKELPAAANGRLREEEMKRFRRDRAGGR